MTNQQASNDAALEKVDGGEESLKNSFERMTGNLLEIGKPAPRKKKESEHLRDAGIEQSASEMDVN